LKSINSFTVVNIIYTEFNTNLILISTS